MSEVAIIDSGVRRMPVELFRDLFNGYEVDHIRLSSGDIATPIGPEYDLESYRALYIRVGAITEDVLNRAPDLELVATCGSGYDHVDVAAATEAGVLVTHTPKASSPGVVEQTFGVLFSLLHRLPEMFDRTAQGRWAEGQTTVDELYGKQLGVVGLGTNGARIATIAAQQFDADVIAYDPYVSGELESDVYPRVSREEIESRGITLVGQEELFDEADIVTLHVPLTDRTRGMVGREELEALAGCYLINTARGEVIDEDALIEAVEGEMLAGVALDVMVTEPPEHDNPLLDAEEVYVTPHIAGGTEGYAERSVRINAERIARVLNGERPDSLVNPAALE
jgi:D-3-phosphoglycerate dehydrogenase